MNTRKLLPPNSAIFFTRVALYFSPTVPPVIEHHANEFDSEFRALHHDRDLLERVKQGSANLVLYLPQRTSRQLPNHSHHEPFCRSFGNTILGTHKRKVSTNLSTKKLKPFT